jgi:hypothetical protein
MTMKRVGSELRPTATGETMQDVFERLAEERPDHAATPLNPYSLREDGGVAYIRNAQQHVEKILKNNLQRLHFSPPEVVVELLETSINSALFNRAQANQNKTIPLDCDNEIATLFEKACRGFATPVELLELFMRYPDTLGSIELAKQTHPFDWRATEKMDIAVDEALSASDFSMRGHERTQNVRYYYLRADDSRDPKAIILRRKADIAVSRLQKGSAVAVQRDSFVLDLTHEATTVARSEVTKWIRQLRYDQVDGDAIPYDGGTGLVDFVNAQLSTQLERRSPAIYPGVRSYYVKNVS